MLSPRPKSRRLPERRFMRRLNNLAPKDTPSRESLKVIFGSVKPRTHVLSGDIKVAHARMEKPRASPDFLTREELERFDDAHSKVIVSVFNPESRKWGVSASCGLDLKKGHVWLHTARSAKGSLGSKTKREMGENLFRLLLNQAANFAIKNNVNRIKLRARNESLREYYERLGFRFNDKKDALIGTLLLHGAK